jgi:hypothetical protein
VDYISVPEHFQQAGLSVFNNNWSSIHDFTPIEGENNWCLFPDTIRIQDYVSLPALQELQRYVLKNLQIQYNPLQRGPHVFLQEKLVAKMLELENVYFLAAITK